MAMAPTFTVSARRLGMWSAAGTVIVIVAYAAALIAGLASLESPHDPIGDPLFSVLEVLIILLMPVLLALMAAVHAWAPTAAKVWSLLALAGLSGLATGDMQLRNIGIVGYSGVFPVAAALMGVVLKRARVSAETA